MDKDLKNGYDCLDLPYDATVEQIQAREKALTKIFLAKADEKNKSFDKQINNVKTSANLILENIKKNGIPKEERHKFETSAESIVGLLIVFLFVGILCFFSFKLLM